MLKKLSLLMIVSLAVALVGSAIAGEEMETATLEGDVVCAHCKLKAEGITACQNVLVVKAGEEGAEPAHYYIAENDLSKEIGMSCKGGKQLRITGTVAEKDGRKWITASKIEPLKES